MMTKETDPVIVAIRAEMAEYRRRIEALEREKEDRAELTASGVRQIAIDTITAAAPSLEYARSRKL